MYTYGSTSVQEQIERLYQYLYYLGVDAKTFQKDLQESPQTRAAIFGLHRANSVLSPSFDPVSANEIRDQVQLYSDYIQRFSQQEASHWPLAYVIMIDEGPYNLSVLDRWYSRDGGERVGGSVIYRVQLRNDNKP